MSTKGTHIPDWLAVPFAGITPAPSQQKGQDLFPTGTGRVCYHPCEQACNRGKYDEAISIRAVERFLGDLGQALPRDVVTAGAPTGKKVAVVGSGPAGHSAAYQL